MNVRFIRRSFRRRLKLNHRFPSPLHSVQCLPGEHMGTGGFRIQLQDVTKLIQRARIVFRPQTALRQDMMQLDIARVRFRRRFQLPSRFRKSLRSVIAEAQQDARLLTIRIGAESTLEWRDRCLKMSLLELGQT